MISVGGVGGSAVTGDKAAKPVMQFKTVFEHLFM